MVWRQMLFRDSILARILSSPKSLDALNCARIARGSRTFGTSMGLAPLHMSYCVFAAGQSHENVGAYKCVRQQAADHPSYRARSADHIAVLSKSCRTRQTDMYPSLSARLQSRELISPRSDREFVERGLVLTVQTAGSYMGVIIMYTMRKNDRSKMHDMGDAKEGIKTGLHQNGGECKNCEQNEK